MMQPMNPLARTPRALFALALVLALSEPALAQEPALPGDARGVDERGLDAGPDGSPDAGPDAGTTVEADAEDDGPTEAASDAKRVVRIRRVIALDKQRMTWLKGELRSRESWFEELAGSMDEVGSERNATRDRLEALEADPDADPDEVTRTRELLQELTEDAKLLDTQTDLALRAEKTVREQIDALANKIKREQYALGRLTGAIPADVPEKPKEEAPPAEAPPAAQPLPLPVSVPSSTPSAPKAAAEARTSSAMTAAQLQAQKALERREQDLEVAERELAEFIERKRALQRQIEFEKELAQGDARERENLEHALETMEARLAKYEETGAPAEKIARRKQRNRRIVAAIEESDRASAARAEYLESLDERLDHLEQSQLRITEEIDAAHAAAEKARRQVKWLESPIHPKNIAHWAKERGPRILLVIAAAVFLLAFVQLSARRIARAVVRRRRGEHGTGVGRADTLAVSFRSVSRVLIVLFGVLLVLQEAGVDIRTVLGGAAILGVAVAFGAQDLMKDYFSGFLILLEDQYQLGDLVTIAGVTGTVESVNMRVTVLRDLEGRVHFVPNGNIDHVTNRTYAWGRPVFEIPIGFDEDVDRVMDTLIEVAKGLGEDPDWRGAIIGEPEMLGVDKLTDYGVVIKFMVKTKPDQLFPVRRQLLRRIVNRFRELGIRISVPQRMIVRDGPNGEPL
jgi:small conductance mechanosensitive channel